jgi:hypothetical protein
MGFIKSMKLAKQFIKAQGGFTLWEVEQHYQPLMSQCKTPDELGALLEEWRRVRAGYVTPWMKAAEQCVHTDPPLALVSAADSTNTAGG